MVEIGSEFETVLEQESGHGGFGRASGFADNPGLTGWLEVPVDAAEG